MKKYFFIVSILLVIFSEVCAQYDEHFNYINTNKKTLAELWSTYYGNSTPYTEYDFIIVGSGPAGCVLANRLSENEKHTVLLVEAGNPEMPSVTDVPISVPNLQSTDYNWGYATERQKKACLSMDDHRCNWPHGRGVGGSSIINYQIYTRGNRRDFDRWAAAGNSEWSFKDVLPYYRKMENVVFDNGLVRDVVLDRKYHGFNGPMHVEFPTFRTPIADAFVRGAQQAGYENLDYNAYEQLGVSYIQASTKYGWRNTAAKAYLEPIIERKNLHVITRSRAVKITFNDARNEAVGITVLHKRKQYYVRARKEVILAAGAFESPKLLMLSGIGPAKHLKELRIPVVKNLPVGETLYEHMAVFGPIFTVDNSTDGLINLNSLMNIQPIMDFYAGKGPLTSCGVESLLYIKTNNSISSDPKYPDVELIQAFTTPAFDTAQGTRLGIRLSTEAYNAVFKPLENRRAFSFLPMLLHPRSKGYLKLKSKNPFHHPLFYPQFFEDERDIDTLVEGIREGIRVTQQDAFKSLGIKLYDAKIPGCEGLLFNSDEYWRCFIQHLSATLHHQVGTCKMGPVTDNSTVVDQNGRVHSFRNLRVADVGIIPEPPSGHTAAYSYMIGEKIADMIKSDWNLNSNSLEDYRRKKRQFDWQPIGAIVDEVEDLSTTIKYEKENVTLHEIVTTEVPTVERMDDVGVILWGHDETKVEQTLMASTTTTTTTTSTASTTLLTKSTTPPMTSTTTPSTPTTTESNLEKIMDTMPTANEDVIRVITLKKDEHYGKGHAKPKYLSLELSKMNSTEYTDKMNIDLVNGTLRDDKAMEVSTKLANTEVVEATTKLTNTADVEATTKLANTEEGNIHETIVMGTHMNFTVSKLVN